jgi:hypothetical protein
MKKIIVHLKENWVRHGFETLVVTVGILGAFTLNNWNENRKERVMGQYYLESLKKEMEVNIQTAQDHNEYNEFQYKNAELILASFDEPVNNIESLTVAIEHIGWLNPIRYIRDVWEELNTTGNRRIIKNQKLKSDLVAHYRNMNTLLKLEENEWSKYNLECRRLVGDVLPTNLRLEIAQNLTPGRYSGTMEDIGVREEEIIEELMQLPGLNGYLVDIVATRKTSQYFGLQHIESMENIISLIEEELK